MKLLFCRSNTIGSWLIRSFTWSRWSHVAIVEDDCWVIESTLLGGGVRRKLLTAFVDEHSSVEPVDVRLADEEAALDFLRAQLGKPYDWTALLGFIFHRDWAEPDAWFCSELAEAAAVAGGRRRFREEISRITPRESWMVT